MNVAIDPSTPWQPRGGEVHFTVEAVDGDAAKEVKDAKVVACFKWTGPGADKEPNVFMGPVGARNLSYSTVGVGSKASFGVTVPSLPGAPDLWQRYKDGAAGPNQFSVARTVPEADMRIIVLDGNDKVVFVADRTIGVTSVWAAGVLTFLAVVLTFFVLDRWAKARRIPGSNAILRLIVTEEGYASLSQFQIMLWSFLFGAGAIYVMGLSGSLIDISTGALVLLGITGASTVAAKIKTDSGSAANAPSPPPTPPAATAPPGPVAQLQALSQSAHGVGLQWTAPATVPGAPVERYRVEYSLAGRQDWQGLGVPVLGTSVRVKHLRPGTAYDFQVFAENAAGASAATKVAAQTLALGNFVPGRVPRWSDLVATSTHPAEIDVTRVQMLLFTLISAGFVAIKLFNSYMIPNIPEGFMLLMGISNGVYVSAKFARDR